MDIDRMRQLAGVQEQQVTEADPAYYEEVEDKLLDALKMISDGIQDYEHWATNTESEQRMEEALELIVSTLREKADILERGGNTASYN